jgi:NADH:ubiquinone oxidoreductase subunit H
LCRSLGLGILAIRATLHSPENWDVKWILVSAVFFAILLCFVLLTVLLVLIERPESLRDELRRRAGYHEVSGVSRKIAELMKFVYKVAASEATAF